jgi:hypothetical protein
MTTSHPGAAAEYLGTLSNPPREFRELVEKTKLRK